MTAREQVLARIRSALGPDPAIPAIPRQHRQAGAPAEHDLLDLLTERLIDYRATVVRAAPDGVADAVAEALGHARRIVVPAGLPTDWLPAGVQAVQDDGLTAEELDDLDAVVTGSALAIAATGTIVLDGSIDQGRRAITLVPDLHVCVVDADTVVASVPDGIATLDPHRPQTWISGPSATSDIELNRVEGVHGPRTLAVILVGVPRG